MYSSRNTVCSACCYFARELCDAAPGVSSTLRREDAKRLMMNYLSVHMKTCFTLDEPNPRRVHHQAFLPRGTEARASSKKNSLCVFVINIRHTTPSSRYVLRSLTSCRRSRRTCAGATCLVCNRRGDRTRQRCCLGLSSAQPCTTSTTESGKARMAATRITSGGVERFLF